MSTTLTFNGAPTASADLAPNRFPAAIPQDPFNPLAYEMAVPAAQLHAALTRRHQWDMLAEEALITPDGFFKKHPFQPLPGEDTEARKRRLANRVFLRSRLDGAELPSGDLGYEVTRARIASRMFDGRGANDDAAFHTEALKHLQTEKDKREVAGMVADEAAAAALAAAISPGTRGGAWKATREKLKLMPGYDPADEADHVTRFRAVEQDARDAMAPYAQELAQVWQGWQESTGAGKVTGVGKALATDILLGPQGESGASRTQQAIAAKSTRQTAFEIYDQLAPEDRPKFMAALGVLAASVPKEEKPAFFANIAKQSGRDLESLVQQGVTGAVEFFSNPDNWDTMNATGKPTKYRRQSDFMQQVQNLQEGKYDSVKKLSAGWWGQLGESVAYGTTGVLATSLAASNPYTAVGLFSSLKEMHYQSLLEAQQGAGIGYEKASAFATQAAPLAALAETGSEMLGSSLLRGKLPFLDRALTGAMDGLKNPLVRAGTRFVAGGAEEGGMEIGQNYIDQTIRGIANAFGADTGKIVMPSAQENIESFAMVFPLALMGIPGAFRNDIRVKAFANASDLQLGAMGVSEEGIAGIRDGLEKGLDSGARAIDEAMQTRDPDSDAAKAAATEMGNLLKAQLAAGETLKASGVLPDVVVSKEGFQVRDPETREIIGTAPDAAGALRIASAHSAAMDDAAADEVAYWMSSLEGARAAVALDPQSKLSVELDRVMTEAAIAAENPTALDDFHAQQRLRELAGGGDGGVADVALGVSNTVFRERVRETTNRIFRGGSVLTAFHETGHGLRRAAHAAGVLTRADDLAILRAVDSVMDGKAMRHGADGARSLRLIPAGVADADVTDKMIDEGISEILEMEVMRTRAGGTKRPDGHGIPSAVNRVAPGIISRNLSALARLAGDQTVGKWKAFSDAVRGLFGLATQRALALRKAERDGLFDTETYDAYLDRLTNTTAQRAHEDEAAGVAGEILGDNPFSIGRMDRPLFTSRNVADLRHDKTAWLAAGATPEGAMDIVRKYYRTAVMAGIPKNAVLVPVPSTSGRNILPDVLAVRISEDLGNEVEKRVIAVAGAKGEAKNKRTFFDKLADPVVFWPDAENLAALKAKGKPVFITEDVHNTGESWIAFARMLQANGLGVLGVATLASTEQRMTSARDIERMAEKIAAATGKPLAEVVVTLQSLFAGSFKQLANKAESDVTQHPEKSADLLAIAAASGHAGNFANPLRNLGQGQGGALGVSGQDGPQSGGLSQGTFGFSLGRYRLPGTAETHSRNWKKGNRLPDFMPGPGRTMAAGVAKKHPLRIATETDRNGHPLYWVVRGTLKQHSAPFTVAGDAADFMRKGQEAEKSGYPSLAAEDGPAYYPGSHTGVIYPNGHEIKTDQTFPDQIPAGGGKTWDRISRNGIADALSNQEGRGADPETTAWLTDALAALPGANKPMGVREAWVWLRDGLNSDALSGTDPVDVMDALSAVLDLPQPVTENNADPLTWIEIAPGGALLVATADGRYSFGALPSAAEVAAAKLEAENTEYTGSSYSLAPSALVSRLNENAISLIRNPRERAAAYQRLSKKLGDLRLTFERLELIAGSKRRKASLKKEAAIREALRTDELVNEAWGRHGAILSDDDLTRLKAQLVHKHLADPNSKMRGRLMSRGQAVRMHPDMFIRAKGGEYDGAVGISRAVFGGQLLPDQAAEELYDDHLIEEPTADAMWDAIRREQAFVEKMREALEKAKDDLRDAKKQAKRETNEWLAAQSDTQAAVFSDKQEILRALAVLDGVLAVVPADIRGKVGGYTQLAGLGSNETRLEFLKRRLAMVDKEMERWLSAQYDREFRDLLKRTRPAKEKPGEKPKGTIGADLHEVFRAVEASMKWKPAEVEAQALALESLAASGSLTPDEEANAITQANLIRLAGTWEPIHRAVLDANGDPTGETVLEYPGADAARREAAVIEAGRIIETGYWANRLEAARKRADRTATRQRLEAATGKAGTRDERRKKAADDAGLKGGKGWLPTIYDLMSFEQVLQFVFGEGSGDAARFADRERWASDRKTDAIDGHTDALAQLYTDLAGGGLAGSKLAWRMAQESITVRGERFSEMEAVQATLMWRQEDGQRHMLGHQDDNGNYVGKWHYDQAFMDELEAALSPEAREVRLFLIERYAAEYARLNPIYRKLNGVNLPQNRFYAPLTVVPVETKAGADIDPVTGFSGGLAYTPGSLKNRSSDAIAEPDFRDAAQTWIAHVKQLEHWMAYAELTQDLQAAIGNRDLRSSMEAKAGKESVQVLSKWIEHFGLGGTRDAGTHLALNRNLSKMAGNAAGVALIGRAGVLAVQSVQLGAALAEMPTGAYLKRFGMLMSGQLNWGDALQSEYIQRRLRQLPPAVRLALEGLGASRPNAVKHAMARVGTMIGAADAFFTAGTYAMLLDYHRTRLANDGIDLAEADREAHIAAQRSCDRIAQPTRAGARSYYEATATHPMARIAWAFASEARQKIGLVLYAAANKDVSWDRKARAVAVTWVIGGLVTTLIRAAWRDMRDDDDEWFDEKNWGAGRLAIGAATGPLKGIPVLGDAIESAIAKLAGQYSPEGNLLSMIPDAARAGKRLLWDGPKDFAQGLADAERLLMGIGVFTDTAAALASASHIVRDAFALLDNAVD